MRWCSWLLAAALLLSGCAAEQTLETVSDEYGQPAMAQPREILVSLPDEAAVPAVEGSSGRIYLCQDYEIVIQTLDGGDIARTVQTISGYNKDKLTVVASSPDSWDRYDFVWATAGESGDMLGRAVILDDGNYHYTMSVLRPAETTETSQIVWRTVFESFSLA